MSAYSVRQEFPLTPKPPKTAVGRVDEDVGDFHGRLSGVDDSIALEWQFDLDFQSC